MAGKSRLCELGPGQNVAAGGTVEAGHIAAVFDAVVEVDDWHDVAAGDNLELVPKVVAGHFAVAPLAAVEGRVGYFQWEQP